MYKIKVSVRPNVGQRAAGRCMSMMRAFALSLDGFQVIAGRTNRTLLAKRHLVFCFSTNARAKSFLQCGRKRMSDVFTFHQQPRRPYKGSRPSAAM